MRIHVSFIDRVGITQEVLALLCALNLNLDAVEMVPPNVYIDAAALSTGLLEKLREALLQVRGVVSVEAVEFLPGHRRRLQLEALLAAMGDPVVAVDAYGYVLLANPSFAQMCGRDATGETLESLFNNSEVALSLVDKAFRLPICEVVLQGQVLLLEANPISSGPDSSQRLAGGLLTFYLPSRIGGRLASLHHDHAEGMESLLGGSQELQHLKVRIRKFASLDAPVLIQGETGTGKELVARACHALSMRHDAPFLALNCAALPESLAESELFGYSAGSFTGAQRGGKPGLLEMANLGTVFLDEVGEMSPYLQAKLLRFLNDGCFRRVGGEREVQVDVRILCATHRNLEKMVAEGTFREDLYYRINVLNLLVPPLRERGQDIIFLAEHFLRSACAQIRRPPCRLAAETFPLLLRNHWAGNVRQLQNVIFRAAAICDGGVIDCESLGLAGTAFSAPDEDILSVISLEDAVQKFEKGLLQRFFIHYPTTRQLANRLSTSHTSIAKRLRKYGISAAINSNSTS